LSEVFSVGGSWLEGFDLQVGTTF